MVYLVRYCVGAAAAVCVDRGESKRTEKYPGASLALPNRLRITMKYFLGPVTVKPTQGDLSRNALQRHNAFYCQGEKKGGRKKVIEV